MIDHTLLKPDGTEAQIRTLCAEARENHFATVCVNPAWVALSAELLRGSGVKVCTVVGFPLGATLPEVKAFEAERAIAAGASEIDMVQNIGALKSRDYQLVMRDVSAVVQAAHARQASVKVIIEAALLTDEEKVESCAIAQAAGADYVKTSTGFASGGATAADVALMRAVVGPSIGVKAAGGIRSAEDAKVIEERVAEGLADLAVTQWPSDANFILFRPERRRGEEVWQALVDHGVLVRNCASWPGLEDCLRVTIGTPVENDRFLDALRSALS